MNCTSSRTACLSLRFAFSLALVASALSFAKTQAQTLETTMETTEPQTLTEFAQKALASFKSSGEAALGKLFADFQAPTNTYKALDDILPNVKAPTLVVWGAKDGLFPVALADQVVAKVHGAKKIVIADASHFSQIDDPAVLSTALSDFFV